MMTETNPQRGGRWPVWALAVVLYPFAAGAAAVNLFFLGLMSQVIGLRVLSTSEAIIGGLILGVPFAWITGRWIRGLIDEAEDGQ
ncbi:hypothetical protein [Aliiroseovarius sp.]|uniref:hypothetical protein n=1 Tax=Aliiroseovarius sp. TaxID=1872442 RepID=UPI0026371476|nr:hypothetical protein [Aliiroseovarius sp.]